MNYSTRLTCEVPLFASKQMQNCSTSWLPKGTIAYFKCQNDLKKQVKGRIICLRMEPIDMFRKEERKTPNLPCGISRLPDKPEIHIYGYQTQYILRFRIETTVKSIWSRAAQ
ncbi:hypothetical protein Ocin01_14015 [Orchesella cincta]|uniref:Uncharacterized protein n=1 Tax=Orchesella cincta TaxID=48709 RepID=A0A1D2MI99_ORCCI|nr:hypothetical protein Ocin01_14015 [Orchesella cincta]